jgi:pimeloyl-ACP methyl ester carboxylesterase
MAHFVLVHGAFYGAWCWERIIPLLSARGHVVYAPVLTGLGELSHLLSPAVGLQTHVDDVVNFLESRNLREVVLVGHSYSGMVIGSAAHRAPERIAHLVYLDAFVPEDGKSLSDIQSERFRQALYQLAQTEGEGWKIPPLDPTSETLGVTDDADVEWLRAKLTAHPYRTLIEPAVLGNPKAEGIPRTFIFCTGNPPDGSFPRLAGELKGRPDWKYMEINSSHSAMITAPEALSEKLLEVVKVQKHDPA